MQRDSTPLRIFRARPLGHSFHIARATRGTYQRFLVPICRDQNQRFRCSVLLDTPTSHGRPFQRGMWHGSGYPLKHRIYRLFSGRAKA
jgi:hypothetical protein